jgi:putative ABC transport system substrate-binding protein
MTLTRRYFLPLFGSALALLPASAENSERLPIVGVLTGNAKSDSDAERRVQAFREALSRLGWIENENYRLEVRWPGPVLANQEADARELVALEPDVILVTNTAAARSLQLLTQAIPIVFVGLSDPVATGLVSSVARPSGNITGFALYEHSFSGKWVSLLKRLAPHVKEVSVLFNPETAPYAPFYIQAAIELGSELSVSVKPVPVRDADQIDPAILSTGASGKGGLIILPDGGFVSSNSAKIISAAAKHRVPAIFAVKNYVMRGGLMSYGPDLTAQFQDGASYVDRILRGTKPSELPVQFATKFNLAINTKVADQLGLSIPEFLSIDAELIED